MNLDKEKSTRNTYEDHGLGVERQTQPGKETKVLSVPSSLLVRANICLPNICFSISIWITFLPFEVLDSYLILLLLAVTEASIV